jgi:hypothetical protein
MFLIGILILFSISSVFAISAAIGNGRMILRGEVGDVVERYVNVINQNDFDVLINVSVTGDLKNYVSLVDESFVLSGGEEKKAYFDIEFAKSGTSDTKINVQFTPVDDEGGAGLSSSVIVIAEGDDSSYSNNKVEEGIDNVVNYLTGSVVGIKKGSEIIVGSLIMTTIIFIVFLVVLILYSKKKANEEASSKVEDKKVKKTKSEKSDKIDE